MVIGDGPGGSISRALPSETFAESLAVWARYRNMSPNYLACKIADALGMHTIDRSQAGALFERYFSSRQRRLEFYST
ncbi:hypothetical protein Airi02_035540 [Actinoallomurus iriomotensis]|uniref:Uncharacterized protein n=1 Tax=Actinoallomurus iriomotensis TaxID=478107 RepID=A0A9W6VZ82_9ACTN|nr:hypothetical protein Airi02_035540 [Actinoallomurus iriomotensis]